MLLELSKKLYIFIHGRKKMQNLESSCYFCNMAVYILSVFMFTAVFSSTARSTAVFSSVYIQENVIFNFSVFY